MMMSALAGSGKSTMACLLSEHTTTSDIYVAFNNSIAEEFRTKIKNPKTKVMTLHSLGLSIMNSNIRTAKEEKKMHIQKLLKLLMLNLRKFSRNT